MDITVSPCLDVRARASDLGIDLNGDLILLPRGVLGSDGPEGLLHEHTASTVRKLWRQAGLDVTRAEPGEVKLGEASEKSIEWIGPTVLIASSVVAQNPAAISVALNVLSNYLTDFFKGFPSGRSVRLEIIIETRGGDTFKRISYIDREGQPESLKALSSVIHEAFNDDR